MYQFQIYFVFLTRYYEPNSIQKRIARNAYHPAIIQLNSSDF
jgi:hypothetical protein